MGWSTIDRALDVLFAPGPRSPWIGFSGGEPLLAFDLVRRTVEAAEERARPGTRPAFQLTTNGLLLDARTARFLEEHGVETRVSFDGSRAAQALRGPGTFVRVRRSLRALRREHPAFFGPLVDVAVTVSPAAVAALAASVDTLVGCGVRHITLAPADVPGRKWTPADERTLDHQLDRVFRLSVRLYERTGRVPLRLFRHGRGRWVSGSPRGAMCGVADGDTLTVDVDGEVSGCPVLARSYQTLSAPGLRRWVAPLRIGRIDAPDLAHRLSTFRSEVGRSPLFGRAEDKRGSRTRCAECPVRAECLVCPVAIARAGVDPHAVPPFVCAFNRLSLKYRRAFPSQDASPAPTPAVTVSRP